MLPTQKDLVKREIEDGTGAGISLDIDESSTQTGLKIRFSDLARTRGPIVSIVPTGLKRYSVRLVFGDFSREIIQVMQDADEEQYQLARALIRSICRDEHDSISIGPGMDLISWTIPDSGFEIRVKRRNIEDRFGTDALTSTCREIVVPVLGAMAELIGYKYVDEGVDTGELEGAVLRSLVKSRERNPRNRLLCLRIHEDRCKGCGTDPKRRYGECANILEVHHLEPLSLQSEPRRYDPETDLVPLCPNCHRYVHTRKPTPWTLADLHGALKANDQHVR